MKGRSIILDHVDGREAAALMVDGELDDLLIDADAPRPGTVYRAVVDRPVKGQGGVFLQTPAGPAFLRQVKGLAPGQTILVQVTGYAEAGKALPVTQKLLFKSRYVIVTPGAPGVNISRSIRDETRRDQLLEIAYDIALEETCGLILRSSCAEAQADDIADDVAQMMALAEQIVNDPGRESEELVEGDGPHILAWRDWVAPGEIVTEPGGFERHGVLDEIDRARREMVPLDGGGCLYIEPTRALVAVDVNTGRDGSLAAGLKANVSCAKALPRALRLRGLGGQIVLDLAPMAKKDRRSFETALRQAFRADGIETALVGWTPLGHFELQRKRARPALSEILT